MGTRYVNYTAQALSLTFADNNTRYSFVRYDIILYNKNNGFSLKTTNVERLFG